MTVTRETLRYVDRDGDQLAIYPIPDASGYQGDISIVAMEITDTLNGDGEPAIVYIRLEDVDRVIGAIREAAGQIAV